MILWVFFLQNIEIWSEILRFCIFIKVKTHSIPNQDLTKKKHFAEAKNEHLAAKKAQNDKKKKKKREKKKWQAKDL